MAQPARYLICYDIADAKRLARLHRFVSRHAVMVQYSVYLARLSPRALSELESGIRQRIDAHADDVRIYTLPEQLELELLRREDGDIWAFGLGEADELLG